MSVYFIASARNILLCLEPVLNPTKLSGTGKLVRLHLIYFIRADPSNYNEREKLFNAYSVLYTSVYICTCIFTSTA